MASPWRLTVYLCLTVASLCAAAQGSTKKSIKLMNNCSFPLWPAISSWNTHADDMPTALPTLLKAGESSSLTVDPSWSGTIWGRQGCIFGPSGIGHCDSGDCGGKLRCDHAGAGDPMPSAITTASFTNGSSSVSLEYGYNIPISINVPANNSALGCKSMACNADLASVCPMNLRVTKDGGAVIGCKGSCDAYFRSCSPPEFSSAFQKACSEVFPFQEQAFCPPTMSYTLTFCTKN